MANGGGEDRPPAWWRRRRRDRASSDPLSWSSIDKCLVLAGATLGVRVLGHASNHWLHGSADVGPLLDPATTALFDRVFLVVVAGWVALLVVGASLRPRRSSSDAYVLVTLAWFWATNATHGFAAGYLGAAFWLDQVAAAMLMLLLFGPRPTYLGMIPGAGAFATLLVLERLRILDYAPLLRAPPFDAAGHPLDDWALVQLGRSLLLGGGSVAMAHVLLRRIREHEARLEAMGTTDALTGLPNRRGFRDAATAELSRAQRAQEPISVVMLDVDHFKRVNDQHGHAAGDALLAAVGAALRAEVRGHDVVGRYGGEEFVALLTGASAATARQVAERLRETVAASTVAIGEVTIGATATLGVATWSPDGAAARPDLDALVARADAAMYRGKQAGRDRVVVDVMTR